MFFPSAFLLNFINMEFLSTFGGKRQNGEKNLVGTYENDFFCVKIGCQEPQHHHPKRGD